MWEEDFGYGGAFGIKALGSVLRGNDFTNVPEALQRAVVVVAATEETVINYAVLGGDVALVDADQRRSERVQQAAQAELQRELQRCYAADDQAALAEYAKGVMAAGDTVYARFAEAGEIERVKIRLALSDQELMDLTRGQLLEQILANGASRGQPPAPAAQ